MGAAAMVALACSAPARATDFTWIGAGGGPFTASPLWSPFFPQFGIVGPGGAGDTVNFAIGQPPSSRYTVTDVAGVNDRLLVHNDSLTLDVPNGPSAVDYALLNSSFGSPSFTVGVANGDEGDVILTGGAGAVFQTRYASIGHAAGSTGSVAVANLQWNGFEMYVGRNGTGHLSIQDGGSVSSAAGFLGFTSGSTGMVTVTGAGSTWTSEENLWVGLEGSGTLTIQDGGSVFSSSGVLGVDSSNAGGTVTVTGAGSTWTNSGLTVGQLGFGKLTVADGGSVSSIGGSEIGHNTGSTGTVTVTGAGSTWTTGGRLFIGGNAFVGAGGDGLLTIQSGGKVDVSQDTVMFPNSFLRLQGGTLATTAINFQGGGQFQWSNGTLHVGMFDGNLTNPSGGTLAPGRSAGSTTIDGAYTQQAGATLEIEIGGTALAMHDFVNVSGSALLGGELQLKLIDGFTPSATNTFTVLNALGGIAGVFSNITTGQRLTTTDGDGSFLVHYGATSAFNPNQIVLTAFEIADPGGLPADFDDDGDVDGDDLDQWKGDFGVNALSDANDDGDSDGADFLAWQQQLGSVPVTPAAGAVPEPGGAPLALFSMACCGLALHAAHCRVSGIALAFRA